MSHYRKIDVRIWNDEKFIDMDNEEKLSFLFVLTHPNMTAVGAMRGTVGGLASELKVLPEAFQKAFDKGLLEADPKANIISAKNFLKYNKPENPNVLKAWGAAFDMLPECDIKQRIYYKIKHTIKDYGEGFQKAFSKAFAEGYGKEPRKEDCP